MIRRSTLPRVLLILAAFVFFSANTIYFMETDDSTVNAAFYSPYHLDFEKVRKGPALNLKAAVLVNYENGEVLYAKNQSLRRPIASLSKLVTAMVVLDKKVDLSQKAVVTKEDARQSSRSRLRVGYELTLLDFMYASLMNSDNRATRVLARATSGSIDEFAKEMNRKAKELGLTNTVFFEPTGLDSNNTSTAEEIALILHHAYDYSLIRTITSKKKHRVRLLSSRKERYLAFSNTNLMVASRYDVLAGKTGYIRASDYCLATMVKNKAGERLTLVVLGAPGDKLRFREARRLAEWGFGQI